MKVWITGAGGMLGSCVARALQRRDIAHRASLCADVDISDGNAVADFMAAGGFTHIINAAAFTAVDRAEEERDQASAVNNVAVGHLAEAALAHDAVLLHVSTDYVFDGEATTPYLEDAPTAPLGHYGASKLRGEQRLVGLLDGASMPYYIVRTSWLFGPDGNDFVGKMSARLRGGESPRVVNDQKGRPTFAPDLAEGILALLGVEGSPAPAGVYHFANSGETSWHGLTLAIAERLGIDRERIVTVSSAEFPTDAPRPAYSVLDTSRFTAAPGRTPRPWPEALAECVPGP